MPKKKSKQDLVLPYGVIQEKFTNLLVFTSNMLDRSWPNHYRHIDSARELFFHEFRNAINAFHTIMYICSDTPKDPLRLPRFALSLPPLTRTLFEQLTLFVFVLEDIPAFVPWLFKTGYTETRLELEHCQKYHGKKPNWRKYIAGLKKKVSYSEMSLALTKREISNPKQNIGRGPTPGGLLKVLRSNRPKSKAIPFMEYVQSWLYRELSGQAHLNVLELAHRGVLFSTEEAKKRFGVNWEKKQDEHLEQYRQKQIFLAIAMMVAMSTEIEAHFHFGKRNDIKYLWTVLVEHSDMAQDLWESRYASQLGLI